MLQPLVLPSNAPPVLDEIPTNQQASRVLQEQSGNRRLNDYTSAAASSYGYEPQKYLSHQLPPATENIWPANAPPQPQQYFNVGPQLHHSQPQPSFRQTWTYSQHRRGYGYPSIDEEQVISSRARSLWKRFQSSDSYKKYRGRQVKDDKKDQEQKWPDHLEEAFFRALIKYPPMGRRKLLHKEKQRGRNELIADHIADLTGEVRSRKQVSSHIQVLKPFVDFDPQIMRWLSHSDMGTDTHRDCRSYSAHNSHAHTNGRRMSTYPAAALQPTIARTVPPPPSHQSSQMAIGNVRKLKHNLNIFEPISFSMFVQRKLELPNGEQQEDRLHTYTQNLEQPLGPDLSCPNLADFQREFPQLAALNDSDSPLDCNVIVADASLAFPTDSFKDTSNGVELGISFVCQSRHLLSPAMTVRCRNSFYCAGRREEKHMACFDIAFSPAEDGRSVTTSMKFGSMFWAKTLAQLAAKVAADEGAGQMIKDVSVMQEVVVLGPGNAATHERILVMLWKFRQSSAATGRASWRRLVLPSAMPTSSAEAAYPEPKAVRVDSMYECPPPTTTVYADTSSQPQPTLQSPFEYNSAASDIIPPAATFDFDLDGSQLNLGFDPAFGAFDHTAFEANAFDSTAFNFVDTTGAAEFAQDPSLDQYGTQSTWAYGIESAAAAVDASYGLPPIQTQAGGSYDSAYESQYNRQPSQPYDEPSYREEQQQGPSYAEVVAGTYGQERPQSRSQSYGRVAEQRQSFEDDSYGRVVGDQQRQAYDEQRHDSQQSQSFDHTHQQSYDHVVEEEQRSYRERSYVHVLSEEQQSYREQSHAHVADTQHSYYEQQQHPQSYEQRHPYGHEQQAYEGAGQEGDALAALADASFLAQSIMPAATESM